MQKLGLIAGNGRFPFLLLDAARAHGLKVVVAAINEETDPEIDARAAADPNIHVHWLSLGELSKLIETFQAEGVTRAVMAGQVKHKQIFSSIRPDWRLAKLLLNLRTRNTDMLLGAVAKVLGDEGIELISSTTYLEPLLAKSGVLTSRAPDEEEEKDIAYGRTVARAIAAYDLGQTVVIAAQACVAVEAMEGTDATIARAGELFRTLDARRRPPSPPPPSAALSPSSKWPNPTRTCASTCPSSASPPFGPCRPQAQPASPSKPDGRSSSTPRPSSLPPIWPASPSSRSKEIVTVL